MKQPLTLPIDEAASARDWLRGQVRQPATDHRWRKAYRAGDLYKKSDILRAIADISQSPEELNEVADLAEGMPEQTNILWAVAMNPHGGESSVKAKNLYEQFVARPGGAETAHLGRRDGLPNVESSHAASATDNGTYGSREPRRGQ